MNSRNVTYSTIGDYQLPNLTLPRQEKTLGKYGRLRRTYLMKHRPVLYNSMLLSGILHPHLLECEQPQRVVTRRQKEVVLRSWF
ncbi:MAG: TnpV protein [Faecalibacterium sp.]